MPPSSRRLELLAWSKKHGSRPTPKVPSSAARGPNWRKVQLAPMRILIAEDDNTSRMILASILSGEGYDVTSAEEGGAAWQLLQQPDAPSLAIVDLMMPGLDGLELVRRVRALPNSVP